MNKTIKIIELLNKIANGEEINSLQELIKQIKNAGKYIKELKLEV